MRELKKQLLLRSDELLTMLLLEAGAFVFGEAILHVAVGVFGEEDEVFQLGLLMAVFMVGMCMVFMGVSSLALGFNIGVGMGASRRRFIPAFMLFTYLEFLVLAAIAKIFGYLEKWILEMAYPGMDHGDVDIMLQWKYILVAGIAVVACNVIFGAISLKFGKVSFVILWLLWMAVIVGIPRMVQWASTNRDSVAVRACRSVLDAICSFKENGILAGIAALSAVLMLISWIMLRRQQVTA